MADSDSGPTVSTAKAARSSSSAVAATTAEPQKSAFELSLSHDVTTVQSVASSLELKSAEAFIAELERCTGRCGLLACALIVGGMRAEPWFACSGLSLGLLAAS